MTTVLLAVVLPFLVRDFGFSDLLLLSLLIFWLPWPTWLVPTLKGECVTAFDFVGSVGVVNDFETAEAVEAVHADILAFLAYLACTNT